MRFSSRKLAEAIYGGHQPRDVALALALGILCGAITGGNVSWAAVLLAAVLFNVHTRLFLAAWLASVLLAWMARGALETVGRWLLDATPLGRALGQLGDGVLLALAGWDQYVVVGGVAVGASCAVVLAVAAYRLTRRLGRCSTEAASVVSPEVTTQRSPATGRRERTLLCLWLGPSNHEQSLRREMTPRRLRRYGVPAALAASLALAITSWSLAGWMAKQAFLQEFSTYNGAEVSASNWQLSLWSGQFVVRDLHVADPRRLDRDRVRVGVAKGRLVSGALLRGRLEIEKLVLEQVRLNVSRRTPAHAVGTPTKGPEPVRERKFVPARDDLLIEGGLCHWQTVCQQLGLLKSAVLTVEELSRAEEDTRLTGVARRRSDLRLPRPRVAVHQLRIADLAKSCNLGRKSLLEVNNLSSNAALARQATELKVVLPRFGAEVRLEFALQHRGQPHTLHISARDVELAQLIDPSAEQTLDIHSGRASLSGEGSFDRQRVDARLRVEVESLSATVAGSGPLAGVEPAAWTDGLARLGSFRAALLLAGPWSSPSVLIDRGELVEGFKRQLAAAGEQELVSCIERQIAYHKARPAQSLVVQTSAVSPPAAASQPAYCEFCDDTEPVPDALVEPETSVVQLDAIADENGSAENFPPSYPTTSVPKDAAAVAPLDISQTQPAIETASRRPLPGPVNMLVGRDPNRGAAYSPAEVGAMAPDGGPRRENFFSRWAHGLRHKLGQTFAGNSAEEPPDEPLPVDLVDPTEEEAGPPIPAAASQAWYNRVWR